MFYKKTQNETEKNMTFSHTKSFDNPHFPEIWQNRHQHTYRFLLFSGLSEDLLRWNKKQTIKNHFFHTQNDIKNVSFRKLGAYLVICERLLLALFHGFKYVFYIQ